MKIKFDENGYISEWSCAPNDGKHIVLMDGIEINGDRYDFGERFEKIKCYKKFGNGIVFDEALYAEKTAAAETAMLRARREKECFKIIDRSVFWYDSLTNAQKEELRAWYTDWLNVTDTKIIPTQPSWLKE